MRHALSVALSCLCLAIVQAGCKTERIRDISSPVPVGLSAQQVGTAIEVGAARRSWIIVHKEPGNLIARIDVRARHMAEVEIRFDERSYQIAYRDSQNLNAHGDRVHQNYLRWIAKLDQAIRAELVRTSAANAGVDQSTP